ncbi:hypothetical protein Spiro2_000282 [Spirobacillus cienkowskii]
MDSIKLKIFSCCILFLSPFYSSTNYLNINFFYTEYIKSNKNFISNTNLVKINRIIYFY